MEMNRQKESLDSQAQTTRVVRPPLKEEVVPTNSRAGVEHHGDANSELV
jgi:hypothetical protein